MLPRCLCCPVVAAPAAGPAAPRMDVFPYSSQNPGCLQESLPARRHPCASHSRVALRHAVGFAAQARPANPRRPPSPALTTPGAAESEARGAAHAPQNAAG